MKRIILLFSFVLLLSSSCFSNSNYYKFVKKFAAEKLPYKTNNFDLNKMWEILQTNLDEYEIKKYIPPKSGIQSASITPYKIISKLYSDIDFLIYICFFDSGNDDLYLVTYQNGQYVDFLHMKYDIDQGIVRAIRNSSIDNKGKIIVIDKLYNYTFDQNNPNNEEPVATTCKIKTKYYQIQKNGKIIFLNSEMKEENL